MSPLAKLVLALAHSALNPAPLNSSNYGVLNKLLEEAVESLEPTAAKADAPTASAPTGTYAGELLREAARIVDGDRNQVHGNKERSFIQISSLWEEYLRPTNPGIVITAVDVAWMMTLVKIARSKHGEFVPDHAIDAAGYSAIAGELARKV